MSEHFVATIKVEKIVKREDGRVLTGTQSGSRREVAEGLHVTVKASTLESLKSKVNAHMAIMDEEDIQ